MKRRLAVLYSSDAWPAADATTALIPWRDTALALNASVRRVKTLAATGRPEGY
jgi:hypothetical protein